MERLYPIIRRQRRPLVIAEAPLPIADLQAVGGATQAGTGVNDECRMPKSEGKAGGGEPQAGAPVGLSRAGAPAPLEPAARKAKRCAT
jgi:hypothetical protein